MIFTIWDQKVSYLFGKVCSAPASKFLLVVSPGYNIYMFGDSGVK